MTTGISNLTAGRPFLIRLRGLPRLMGPAMVASVAYIDPGNIATNLTAGSRYGYQLVWVVLLATGSAALFQFLSAKLGMVTGYSLPGILGQRIKNRPLRLLFWIQAEVVAIATDVAEVLGAAIALSLFAHTPMLLSAIVVALVALAITALRNRGSEFSGVVITLMLFTTFGFSYIMLRSPVDWLGAAGGVVPHIGGIGPLILAASIIGATIMPHAIYAHSSLSRDSGARFTPVEQESKLKLFGVRTDVAVAMIFAGLGNMAVLLFGAANFSGGNIDIQLSAVPKQLDDALGSGIGLFFVVLLFSSGIGSSAVGNYAADEITSGLIRKRINPMVRWLLALVPALLLIGLAPNVTDAMVYSQVILSFGLPFAIFPLVRFTACGKLMGHQVNSRKVTVLGYSIASALTGLSLWLVFSLLFA